uniref:arginine--tRNA ligase n=1 Tax=Lotharella globosa TaxID=91324 RepID=A0A7S3Z795_9EUKA
MQGEEKSPEVSLKPLEDAKKLIAQEVAKVAPEVLGAEIDAHLAAVAAKVSVATENVRRAGEGDLTLPAFAVSRFSKKEKNPAKIAAALAEALKKASENSELIADVKAVKMFINIVLTPAFLGKVILSINDGKFLAPIPKTKDRVMIEYSQPNTHKAFHVGHMRNAALGDCLVRLYEFVGHPVVAANYFGDEGAHIAKCLWKLKRFVAEQKFDIDTIPEKDRAEWLGGMYQAAVSDLDMGLLTKLPFPNVVAAKVLSVNKHPAADAPPNWHVVELQVTESEKKTVVCGGRGYKEGDFVAYLPLGNRLKNKEVIAKDMKGVESCGVMLAYTELGVPEPADPPAEKKGAPPAETKEVAKMDVDKGGKGGKKGKSKKNKKGGGGGGGKKKKKQKLPGKIFIVEPKYKPTAGAALTELGKITEDKDGKKTPAVDNVVAEINKRNKEVGDMLLAMETGDKDAVALWEKTKKWSLDEFKKIYAWLDCRFDHDFFESEVSESSRQMVIDEHKKGTLIKDGGAICADLNKYKLGFMILLKSNGAGLYATKDLKLAQIKFEQFKVDKSIYVVDASQSLHFQQVFKILELMGYEQAKKCVHLPYGMVVLPSGKMSSRKGTVIFFSQLQTMLNEHLHKEYLAKYEGKWTTEDIEYAKRQLAVGTIKYGMLNHDVAKDVVFEMSKWSAKTGTTGIYNMYAYTRTVGIKNTVAEGKTKVKPGKVNVSLLGSQSEREMLMHISNFWTQVYDCVSKNNPSGLCNYVWNLSKLFNVWYENNHVAGSEDPDELATRLAFASAIGATIKKCLELLGITPLKKM